MIYYLRFVRGLKVVVQAELSSKIEHAQILSSTTEKLRFNYDGDPHRLLTLRSVEDIYAEIFRFKFDPFKSPFNFISSQVAKSDIEKSLFVHRQINSKPPKRTSFRFDVSITGEYPFHRKELRAAFQEAIFRRFSRWRLETQSPMLEFWVDLYKDEVSFALRINSWDFKLRSWKVSHLEASLKPTIAYALLWLSQPQKGEILLDPMCGVGTILIEGALNFPFSQVLGGDLDNKAIRAARQNRKKASAQLHLANWDVSKLPLKSESIDRIVTNPPWGKKIVSDKLLYQKLFSESIRTLRTNGIMIVLSSDENLISEQAKRHSQELEAINPALSIEALGQTAQAFTCRRR